METHSAPASDFWRIESKYSIRAFRFLFIVGVLIISIATSLANHRAVPTEITYISFSYDQSGLEEVIADLEKRYDLSFAYSPGKKLVGVKVSARSGLVELTEGLGIIFAGTPIEYRIINGRVALRFSSRLEAELLAAKAPAPKVERPTRPRPARKVNTIFRKKKEVTDEVAKPEVEPPPPAPVPQRPVVQPAPVIPREETNEVPWQSSPVNVNDRKVQQAKDKRRRLARFSVFPGLSTSQFQEASDIHTLSLNVPAGISGGLSGVELGLLYNGINGNMEGLQLSGLLNMVDQKIIGVQVAGLGNGAGIGTGIQIAGGFNYCRRTLQGTQISGLANIALNGVGRQYALGLNMVQGDVKRQIGLVNRAVNVSGGQIGLINISDTISGRSFGLINFVRKGYNVLEFSRTSIVPWQVGLKLGSHRFYNTFELGGGRRDLKLIGTDERTDQATWSVGYGLGWINRIGRDPDWRMNTEIVGTHLIRGGKWQSRLNFIISARWTLDFKTGQFTNFFIGPVINFHWSQLTDDELDNLFVSGWQLWKKRYDNTAFRGVLGVRFGARLGRK